MGETLSAVVEDDSRLVEEFEEYRQHRSMNTKSEAVRALVRAGLDEELEDDDDRDQEEQPAAPAAAGGPAAGDWIRGNEPILFGIAFLIGSDGLLSALTTSLGPGLGTVMFVGVAVVVVALLGLTAARRLRDLWRERTGSEADHQVPAARAD